MSRALMAGLMLWAGLAAAQNASPELAPFPLEIIRTSPDCTKQDSEDLGKLLPMMLRAAGVSVPGSAKLNSALTGLRRQDCNRDDQCLAQLGKLAGSLYAFYGQVDFDLDGNVVASGRVVRDDGRAVRGPKTVKLPRAALRFRAVAQAGLEQLLTELDVAGLPPLRPMEPVVEVARVQEPLTLSTKSRPWNGAALASVVAGAGCVAIGVGFIASAAEVRTETSGGVVRVLREDADKVAGLQRSQTVGVALLAVGAGLGVVGAGLFVLGPVETVTTVVPTPGGGAVLMTGRFP